MALFDLVAKLTLDSSEYSSALHDAESEGGSIGDVEAVLDLDTDPFHSKVEEVEKTTVDGPDDPDLDLDDTEFEEAVDDANGTVVDGPDDPDLGLDTTDFSDSLDDAESEAETFSLNISSIMDGIKGAIAAAGIAATVKGVVDSLSEAVDLAAKLGDDVDKGSRRLNISAQSYQEWSHALSQSGASISDFNRGILSMNKYMSGADVTEDVVSAFDRLGVGAKVANGEIASTEQLLTETVKALADFPGSKEERGALATAIFGRGGNTLNALFDSGAAGIEQLLQEAHELGLVMTDEEVAKNVAYGDALANVQAAVTALKTSVVSELMPPLTELMNTAAKVVAFFNWRTGDAPLSKQFEDIDKGAMDSLASINMTESVAGNLADKLIAMGDASKLTAEQQAVWKGTAEELIDLIPSLSEVIDTDAMSISGNTEAIQDNIKEWANLARQRALNEAIEKKQRAMQEEHTEAIEAQVDALVAQSEVEAERTKAAEAANKLLSENTKLQEAYGKNIGDGENTLFQLEDLLTAAEMNPDISGFQELYTIINNLNEAEAKSEKAQQSADAYAEELANAQQEYDAWLEAAGTIFGTAAESAESAEGAVDSLNGALEGLPDEKNIKLNILTNLVSPGFRSLFPKAKGDWDVPYDMPVLVHRGETILTTSQAREYREGGGTENNNAALIQALQGLRNDMKNMKLVVGKKNFGRAVVDYGGNRVDGYIGSSEDRYYAGYGE